MSEATRGYERFVSLHSKRTKLSLATIYFVLCFIFVPCPVVCGA